MQTFTQFSSPLFLVDLFVFKIYVAFGEVCTTNEEEDVHVSLSTLSSRSFYWKANTDSDEILFSIALRSGADKKKRSEEDVKSQTSMSALECQKFS